MCIAIVLPVGAEITDEALRSSNTANRDGAGYAFVGDKGMVVKKGYFAIEHYIKDLRSDLEKFGKTSPFLIHFRISTGGKIGPENCHPFLFKHGALIHNGWFFNGTTEKSDTNILVERIGDKLTKSVANSCKEELSAKFGGNKVAVLFNDKTFTIFNEDAGWWDKGVWYSNKSYCAYAPARTTGQLVPSGARFAAGAPAGAVVQDDDDLSLWVGELRNRSASMHGEMDY